MDDHSTALERDRADAQERLMRILDSVRLEKTHELPSSSPASRASCSQCNSTSPQGKSQWCLDCGYNPQLGRYVTDEERKCEDGDPTPLPPRQRLTVFNCTWLLAALVGPLLLSLAASYLITNPADRTIWGRLQFMVGGLTFGCAHLMAYSLACRKSLSARQASSKIVSLSVLGVWSLWKETLRLFPHSRRVVCLGSCGLATAGLALTIVGVDFSSVTSHMAQRIRESDHSPLLRVAQSFTATTDAGKPRLPQRPTDAVQTNDTTTREAVTVTAAIASPGAMEIRPSQTSDVPHTSQGVRRDGIGEFHIFGYLTNPAGEMKSILLAEVDQAYGRFVGRVSLHEASPQLREHLQKTLDEHRTTQPALNSAYQARWVKPVVVCSIAFTGWTVEGTVRDGYLVTFTPQVSTVPQNGSNLTPVGDQRPLKGRSTSKPRASKSP